MEAGQKRPPEDAQGEADAKKAKVEDGRPEAAAAAAPAPELGSGLGGGGLEDDFDALFDGTGADGLDDLLVEPPVPPEEAGRRAFVDRLGPGRVSEASLAELLGVLRDEAPGWGRVRRWRSAALLLVYVSRASRLCRAAFVAEGLPLLGSLLQEAIATLESGEAVDRQEAGMWTLACLMCLRSLPLGRATLWEHRVSVGKPFDRLHRWCGRERSALAAELRAPTELLCRRWRRQPKPVGQDHAPEHKAVRMKVKEVISQGLMGIGGGNSPASPAPLGPMSPGLPPPLAAAEVEMALYAKYNGPTPEYKQHARMLRSNLALEGNSDLRARILSGEITAEELVAMDSSHLAPEAVQEARRKQLRKNLTADIVQSLVPRCEKDEGDGSPGHHNLNTAPPVWVTAPEKSLPRRNSSFNSNRSESLENLPAAGEGAAGGEGASEAAPPTAATPVPALVPPLVPPPTPFQEGAAFGASTGPEVGPPTPDVMATPHPDDEDEEEAQLVRYLSSPP